jgi:SAM-dependent methyltransferase
MRDWRKFWAEQHSPLHHEDSASFYAKHAAELRNLTGEVDGDYVLELGCGNGALYELMGFGRTRRYVGIDLSERMLEGFRQKQPGLELRHGDAVAPPVDGLADLIFSNGLGQYLDRAEFRRHLRAVKASLVPGGRYVCASLPAREHWLSYVLGRATLPVQFKPVQAMKEGVNFALGRSALGTWFSLRELERAALEVGFHLQVVGSACYLYRYHAVFATQAPGRA